MKWFRHMTYLRNIEAVVRFLDAAGLEGYGFLCMLLELIGENMSAVDQRCELCLSLRRWSIALGIHRNKVLKYAGMLGGTGLATITREGSDLRVRMPILAEWRDEYSKKSGHAPESVRSSSAHIRPGQSKSYQRIRTASPIREVNGSGTDRVPTEDEMKSMSPDVLEIMKRAELTGQIVN